jgi:hypothetical protein
MIIGANFGCIIEVVIKLLVSVPANSPPIWPPGAVGAVQIMCGALGAVVYGLKLPLLLYCPVEAKVFAAKPSQFPLILDHKVFVP